MKTESYKVSKLQYNANMGGMECYCDDYLPSQCIFYIDHGLGIKVGDEVKCERDDNGFYRRVWVNGKLKLRDNFKSVHSA